MYNQLTRPCEGTMADQKLSLKEAHFLQNTYVYHLEMD